MRLKEHLNLRKVGKVYMIVENSPESLNFSNVYTMNSTAAYLWEQIAGKEFDEAMLVELLCEHYEVDKALAMADIQKLVAEWRAYGLLS